MRCTVAKLLYRQRGGRWFSAPYVVERRACLFLSRPRSRYGAGPLSCRVGPELWRNQALLGPLASVVVAVLAPLGHASCILFHVPPWQHTVQPPVSPFRGCSMGYCCWCLNGRSQNSGNIFVIMSSLLPRRFRWLCRPRSLPKSPWWCPVSVLGGPQWSSED
jgi:hypothetical protein